jgi:hypothetical protein
MSNIDLYINQLLLMIIIKMYIIINKVTKRLYYVHNGDFSPRN